VFESIPLKEPIMKTSKIVGIAVAAALVGSVVTLLLTNRFSSRGAYQTEVVDARGNLRVPENYRTRYQSLGTWAIAADTGRSSKEMHDVYASPGTIDAYRKSGRFPDGTVLVKEVFGTSTRGMTTGTVSHAVTLKGWFVMVRDSGNTRKGNSLWGDGWGWSWFDADKPLKTTSTNYKTDCLGCHVPAKSTNWIYVDGYPPLRR
jgi:cytochrome P460